MKSFKKAFAIIMVFVLSTAVFSIAVAADEPSKNDNLVSTLVSCSISGSGLLTATSRYSGASGTISKGVITTKVEKRFLGIFWTTVNIGQPNNQWVDTSYSNYYTATHTVQLSSTGTYRVSSTFKITGTNGAVDTYTGQSIDTY